MSKSNEGTLGPVRTWALAAGGMVGGGIYIALGVVIEVAAQWAWLSFALAGVAAVITSWSYARLTNRFHAVGGAFDFLEEINRDGWAGSLSWLLILGYMLTISVYAFAFGNYLAHFFGGGAIVIRMLAVAIMAAMIGLNLAGAGKLTTVEVIIVSGNLMMLLVLGGVGLARWAPPQLSSGIDIQPLPTAMLGAAAIFVSYEGFQLLTYEYGEMKEPRNWFLPVLVSATAFVVVVYVAVTLGATMISGASTMVEQKDVALAVAAEDALGRTGLIAMTIAAAFATTAAINSTLFSTAKLAGRVADDEELPAWFAHRNDNGIPDRSVIAVGVIAGALTILGSLSSLVEAASLVFVVTFTVVNLIAADKFEEHAWLPWAGALLSIAIGLTLAGRLIVTQPFTLAVLVVLGVVIIFLRPVLLRRVATA
ncbi:MAG: APC family permease [Candidatus Promineifilaceae bacterium]|nr:APC family permease [Candidatus Promineifilaceae bacterium]